jgi:hypothetical protein
MEGPARTAGSGHTTEDRFWEAAVRSPVSRRAFLGGAAASGLAALLAACTGGRAGTTTGPTIAPHQLSELLHQQLQAARSLPKDVQLRLQRGYMAERAGQVITVPTGFNYFDGGISHTTPWPYTQDVPMLWYGPGIIPARGKIDRPVTSADVASTLAGLVGFPDFQAPDGEAMEEVVDPSAPKPKLVVVLVWDAGGNYVLNLWPESWPRLKALLPQSTWYSSATIGSSPSSTAPIHATIGTGAFPRRHGILDNFIRFPDGSLADPWSQGPSGLLSPTFADQYAAAMGQKAATGLFATLSWHVAMLGHGSQANPNVRPVVVLREKGGGEGAEGIAWGLGAQTEPYYRFPDYVNDLPPIQTYFPVAEKADGVKDGKWQGHDISSLNLGFNTPARVPYQQRAIEEVITREGFGHHDAPDLFFINYKLIDEIGHLFTASSLEERDSIVVQDANLPVLIDFLNRQVGEGKWVLLVTADHGHSAATDVSGAFPIKVDSVDASLEGNFHATTASPLAQKIRPGWTYVDDANVRSLGLDMEQVAAFMLALDKKQVAAGSFEYPASDQGDRVLSAAFPAGLLSQLVTSG